MTPDATRCVGPNCQEEGVVGVNGAWLCLTHFYTGAAKPSTPALVNASHAARGVAYDRR
jgi:hypothetical protein